MKTLDDLHTLRDLEDERLTPAHRLVLAMTLAYGHGPKDKRAELRGTYDPSVAQLSKSTGLSPQTINRVRPQLIEWGFLIERDKATERRAAVMVPNLTAPIPVVRPRRPGRRKTSNGETSGRDGTSSSETSGRPMVERLTSHSETSRRLMVGPSEEISEDIAEDTAEDKQAPAPPTLNLFGDAAAPKSKAKPKKPESPDVEKIWAHYIACWRKEIAEPDEPVFTGELRGMTRARLREHPAEKIMRAIDGMFADPWSRGQNDERRVDVRLERIVRARNNMIARFTGPRAKPFTPRNGAVPRQAPNPTAKWIRDASPAAAGGSK